jgi:DNA-binding MarR family transcriptional regulator
MSVDTKTLNKLRLALEVLASDERDARMSAVEMRVFLHSAIQPGITMKDLAQHVGVAQSEISRTVTLFSMYDGQGYGLLRSEEDPHERRRKIVRLTPKGERVASHLTELLK